MNKEELQKLTVVELRKLAKENSVKLGAGIDKAGIIEKLLTKTMPEVNTETIHTESILQKADEVAEATLSADVTSVPNRFRSPSARTNDDTYVRPTFHQAWQAKQETQGRSAPMMQSTRPGWQSAPSSPAQKRFGPQARPTAPVQETQPIRQATPAQKPVVTSDGYRLGYRAQQPKPQYGSTGMNRDRTAYQNNGQGNYRPSSYPPRTQPLQSKENQFHDDVYSMNRDLSFDEDTRNGILPSHLKTANATEVTGIVRIQQDGYAFLLDENDLTEKLGYISVAQIKRFGLHNGDRLTGMAAHVRPDDPYPALLYIVKLNDIELSSIQQKTVFEQLVAIFPTKHITLEGSSSSAMRLIDLLCPIGFGQRSMIIAPPKSEPLSLLRDICSTIHDNDPEAVVLLLMIDDTPEDINEMKEAVNAEVYSASFGDTPESQVTSAEAMFERAQHIAEDGKNAVIVLDSINKLVKAYQNCIAQGTRALSGSVSPSALTKVKKLYAMAKNTKTAGSLSVFAVMQSATGSRVDEIIQEEFKGTANSIITLHNKSFDDAISPMIDLQNSYTRKEDLMLSQDEMSGLEAARRMLASEDNQKAVAQLVDMMNKTKSNQEFRSRLKEWMAMIGH